MVWKGKNPPTILPPVKRIIAIGDLHGDYAATIIALKKAKVIDNNLKWCGEKTYVVQVGDQIDKGGRGYQFQDPNSEMKIMNLFDRLASEALQVGGAVFSILGNHEIMNIFGDFSYSTKSAITDMGGIQSRRELFAPGGMLCKRFCKYRNVVLKIGDWVFVHAGILPHIAKKYSLRQMNNMMRRFLSGDVELQYNPDFKEIFADNDGILWTRAYGENASYKTVENALYFLKAKHMVIGHTPQDNINEACDGHIWRIDTGASRAFGPNPVIQILEICDNGKSVKIL